MKEEEAFNPSHAGARALRINVKRTVQ